LEIKTARYEDYSLFYKFFVTYSEGDFKGINPNDPLMVEIDRYMDLNNQLFYIADVVLLDIKFISKGVIRPQKTSSGQGKADKCGSGDLHPEKRHMYHFS
jgi:hypothetical protein